MTTDATVKENSGKGAFKQHTLKRKHKRLIFYSLMLVVPVLNFLIFYVYQNFSTIIMAFEKYSYVENGTGYNVTFSGFEHFASIFRMLNNGKWYMVWNSFLVAVLKNGLGLFIAIVFSYYIYKKFRFSEFFRVILFLPSVISSVILVVIYKYFVSDIYMFVSHSKYGLMTTHPLAVLMFFNVWVSFGTNVLMFSGTMSGINDSVVEASKIDGANVIQEFFHITIPMSFPTITTFVIIGIAAIFTDQAHLYTFYVEDAQGMENIGYFLYVQSLRSDVIAKTIETKGLVYLSYPEISAFGLIITAVIIPVTFIVRWLMNKFGPSED